MDNFNGYGAYGSYTFPNYSGNFGRQYGNIPNMVTPYNNQMSNFQQQAQQQYNMQQSQGQPQSSNTNVIRYVNGIEGAKAFLVPPSSQVTLFDSDSNHFFVKTTNEQGQAVLKQFEYSEITPTGGQNQSKDAKPIGYLTLDDLPQIEDEIIAKLQEKFFTKKPNAEVKKDVQQSK